MSGKRAAQLAAAMAEEAYVRLEVLGVARCCLPPYPVMVGLMWDTAVGVVAMRKMAKRAARKKKSARQIEAQLVRKALRAVDEVAAGLAGAERRVTSYRPGEFVPYVPGEWSLSLAPAAGPHAREVALWPVARRVSTARSAG
jgi:hypothetical protein